MAHAGLRRIDTRTRQVTRISTTGCPMFAAVDPEGRRLFVSYQCAALGSTPLHDLIDIFKLPEEKSMGLLRPPLMIGGPLYLSPSAEQLWADGYDVCSNNPEYAKYDRRGCPFIPGSIQYIFRTSDGSLLKTIGAPMTKPVLDPVFTPDGKRAVLAGKPARVLDTEFFEEEETFTQDGVVEFSSPQIDYRRRRLYLSSINTAKLYSLDLPAGDCAAASPGRVHLWAGDGTPNDWMHTVPLRWLGETAYSPGLVGQAFRLQDASLEAATDYNSLNAIAQYDGTIAFWVKFLQANRGLRVNFQWRDKPLWQLGVTDDLRLSFAQPGEPDHLGASRLQVGRWYYLALTSLNQTTSAYLDGDLEIRVQRPTDSSRLPVKTRILRFAAKSALLDEIAFYDRALGPSEIADGMRAARACADTALKRER